MELADWIRLAGVGQLSVLVASGLVPLKLNWKDDLASLPRLYRQMYWTYGGYVVMGIITLGTLCLVCADDLAGGSRLARGVAVYGAMFWGVRLGLQAVFEAKPYLTTWWLRLGYHLLTVLFLYFTAVFGMVAVVSP